MQGCAFGGSVINQGLNAYACGGIDDRSQRRGADARIPRHQGFRLFNEFGDKRIGNAGINDNAFGGHANLALIEESAKGGSLHGFVQIGVIQHQQRGLAAQFQQNRL